MIRISMAMLVVWSHSFALYFGSEDSEPLSILTQGVINSGNLAVYVFFVVSGFLITQSFDRSGNAWGFLKKRVARIYPGYLFAIAVCAFVIIPIYSDSASYSFFSATSTIGLNLLLRNYFIDPMPFSHNPNAVLNGSLWSIPYEFWCYLGVLGLGALGCYRGNKRSGILIMLVVLASIRAWLELTGRQPGGGVIGEVIGWPYRWFKLLPCFLGGMVMYLYRDSIALRGWVAFLGGLIVIAVANFAIPFSWKLALEGFVFPAVLAYSVCCLAFGKKSFNAARYGDFSYGAYLYAFPIQQVLICNYGNRLSFWIFVPLAMILALAAGFLSWYCVEQWFSPRARARFSPGIYRTQAQLDIGQ